MSDLVNCKVVTKENLDRPNFKWEEFFVSDTAERLRIVNYPSPAQELTILTSLMSTADMMQEIRDLLKKPIIINSAYRCLELNRVLNSSDSSQHVQGLACDFICPGFGTPEEIVKFLHSKGFIVDQCFNEGSWVHISKLLHKDAKNRMMYGYYLYDKKLKNRIFISI